MKKTVEGKVLRVGVADWWLQGNGLVVGLELSDAPLRNGDHVEVTWDVPPCEHVSFNESAGRHQYTVNDICGDPIVHVWVNYCPICGVKLHA